MIWDWACREASSARISRGSRPGADRKPSPARTSVSSSSVGRTLSAPAPLRPAAMSPAGTALPSRGSRGTAAPRARGAAPVAPALPEQEAHGQAGPADRLDGQDDLQLVPSGGPDQLD